MSTSANQQPISKNVILALQKQFVTPLLIWQRKMGRHQLPWQSTQLPADPYPIWVSEIMLQQTQVNTVINYFGRFITRFPNVHTLAQATFEEVASLWSGLGYYARARNLHQTAQRICQEYGGIFPRDSATLVTLPGIGASTAAAIAVFSQGERVAIFDANVRRVIARYTASDVPATQLTRHLWPLAQAILPSTAHDLVDYTQGIMDLGALVCKKQPQCLICPVAKTCAGYQQGMAASLPRPAIKKIYPHKTALFLLLQRGHTIWLPLRATKGIWGGLRCLPQLCDFVDTKGKTVTNHRPINVAEKQLLTKYIKKLEHSNTLKIPNKIYSYFYHQFTHFALHAEIIWVQLKEDSTVVAAERDDWVVINKISTSPLPAPIKKFLITHTQSDV